jgi:multiple sugar transport system permease protein
MRKKRRSTLSTVLLSLATIVIVLYLLLPIVGVFLASIHTEGELQAVPPHWIPHKPTALNYLSFVSEEARNKLPLFPPVMQYFSRAFRNSVFISVVSAVLALVLGAPVSYTLARLKGAASGYISITVLATRMLPLPAVMIPLYVVLRRVGMLDTSVGLIWVYVGFFTPYAIWMLRGFIMNLPPDLEESAMVEGCTKFGALVRIVIPLSLPGMAAVAVIIFLFSWNLFIIPLLVTSKNAIVMPVVIGLSAQEGLMSFSLLSAIGIVSAVPTLLLAIILHKYIISGLLGGALKS